MLFMSKSCHAYSTGGQRLMIPHCLVLPFMILHLPLNIDDGSEAGYSLSMWFHHLPFLFILPIRAALCLWIAKKKRWWGNYPSGRILFLTHFRDFKIHNDWQAVDLIRGLLTQWIADHLFSFVVCLNIKKLRNLPKYCITNYSPNIIYQEKMNKEWMYRKTDVDIELDEGQHRYIFI